MRSKLKLSIDNLMQLQEYIPLEAVSLRDSLAAEVSRLQDIYVELDDEPPKWMAIVVELVQYWSVMQLTAAYVFRSGNMKTPVIITSAISHAFHAQQIVRKEMLAETTRKRKRPIEWANPDFNIVHPGYEPASKANFNKDITAR